MNAAAGTTRSPRELVDTKNPERGPLLILSGDQDHTVPWAIANASYKKQKRNAGVTEIVKLAGRGHALTIDRGWRGVSDTALEFIRRFTKMTVARKLTALLALVAAVTLAGAASASAPPVGPLPAGPLTTITTHKGGLVAVALPRRSGGRVWRVARAFDSKVVKEVSEADVGASVVVIFRATGAGKTTISFGLTLGEQSKAYESQRFQVRVS